MNTLEPYLDLALADQICEHTHGERFACYDCREFTAGLDVLTPGQVESQIQEAYEVGKEDGHDSGYEDGYRQAEHDLSKVS